MAVRRYLTASLASVRRPCSCWRRCHSQKLGAQEGFVRIHVGAGGRIHGATIVGAQAGELISTFTVAVQSDGAIGAVEIAKAIMP